MGVPEEREEWEEVLADLRAPSYRSPGRSVSSRRVIDAILELEIEDGQEAAEELVQAFEAYLRERGKELPESVLERWKLVRLLSSRELALPADLRRSMARSLQSNLPQAMVNAAARLKKRDAAEAQRIQEVLRKLDPVLARVLEDEPSPRWKAPGLTGPQLWSRVLLAVSVVALVFWIKVSFFPETEPSAPVARADRARAIVVKAIPLVQQRHREDMSPSVIKIAEAIEEKNCEKALAEASALQAELQRVDPARGGGLQPLWDLVDLAQEMCPPSRSYPPR